MKKTLKTATLVSLLAVAIPSARAEASNLRCPVGTQYIYGLLNYSNCIEGFGLDQALVGESRREGSYCIVNVQAAAQGSLSGSQYLESLMNKNGGFVDFCATLNREKTALIFKAWPRPLDSKSKVKAIR